MADDLDDCWWENDAEAQVTEPELQASADEGTSSAGDSDSAQSSAQDDSDGDSSATEDSDSPAQDDSDTEVMHKDSQVDSKKGEKRKSQPSNGEEPAQKKKKKTKRKKISQALLESVPQPGQPGDLITAMTKHFTGKLSAVEMDDLSITDDHFTTSAPVSETPSGYLHTIMTVPKWKKKVKAMEKSPGAPLLLVVCSSAIRAVDIIRDLKKFHGADCKVAKLFAKHLKLAQQTKFLEKSVIHVGVGTPNRIMALLDNESLHVNQTSLVMLDWSWRDAKLRRLIDIQEIRSDLLALLHKHLTPTLKSSSMRIAML